jgi:YVTN family beta-propeller protein
MCLRQRSGLMVVCVTMLAAPFSCPVLARDIIVINEGSDQQVNVGCLAPGSSRSLGEKDGPAVGRMRKVKLGEACFVDPATWKVTGTVPVGPDPVHAFLSPDATRAYVVSKGIADADPADSLGQGSLTIIDVRSRGAVARIGLGYRPGRLAYAPDKALLVCVSLGGEGREAVATFMDLREHRCLGRTRLPDATRGITLSKDGRRLYALAVLEGGEAGAAERGVVRSFDTATLGPHDEISLGGAPQTGVLSPDGRWLYVLESCAAKGVPETDSTLLVSVVATEPGVVAARYLVGCAVGPIVMDDATGRLCVSGKNAGPDGKWRLLVFRGDSLTAIAPLKQEPVRLEVVPGGRLAFTSYGGDLGIVDLVDGREQVVVDLGLTPADIHLRDGKCIVVVGQGGTKVSLVDVDHGGAVTRINAGRHGFKLTSQILMGAAMGAMDVASANMGMPHSNWMPLVPQSLWGMGPSHGSLSYSPDGQKYFVFDVETNDVTIIDVAGRRKIKTIPVGSSSFESQLHEMAVAGGRWIVVSRKGSGSGQTLGIVDMERQKRVDNVELKVMAAPGPMTVDAAHDRVFVPIGKGLQVVQVSTAKHQTLVRMDHPLIVLIPKD